MELKHYWRYMVVSGEMFEPRYKPGIYFSEDMSPYAIKTMFGHVWFVDVEPAGQKELFYAVRISDNEERGCGISMGYQRKTPARCVVEEKIFGWKQAKEFFRDKLPSANNVERGWNDRDWRRMEEHRRPK